MIRDRTLTEDITMRRNLLYIKRITRGDAVLADCCYTHL